MKTAYFRPNGMPNERIVRLTWYKVDHRSYNYQTLLEWCNENLVGRWCNCFSINMDQYYLYFEIEEDAVLYKMTWL